MTDDFSFFGSAEQRSATTSIARRDLPQEIVSRLRQEIVSGQWAPGQRVTEQMLAERFGVSRTPLREALKVVAAERLLVLLPGRGAMITKPTLKEAKDKLLVLGALEALAFQLACEAATDEELAELKRIHGKLLQAHLKEQSKRYFELNDMFHRCVVIAARNQALTDMHSIASRHVKQARLILTFRSNLRDSAKHEHEEILAALMRRDGPAAKQALERHMQAIHTGIRAADEAAATRDAATSDQDARGLPIERAAPVSGSNTRRSIPSRSTPVTRTKRVSAG